MKKRIRKYKNLPKYDLGTRKAPNVGYLPNYGVGSVLFSSTPGLNIDPETKSIKLNTVLGGLNNLSLSISPGLLTLNSWTKIPSMWINPTLSGVTPVEQLTSNTLSQLTKDIVPGATTSSEILAGKTGNVAALSLKGVGESNFLPVASKVLGAVGSAYGLANMGSQIADFGSHRNATDMLKTISTNTYTTAGGHQYTERGGVDRAAELAYERASSKAKDLNFAMSSIGTGASIGSLFTPVGTVIGAGIGALVGGLNHIFGFSNNEDDVKREISKLNESVAGENRQNRSVAISEDLENEFYNRLSYAKEGKSVGGSMKHDNKNTKSIQLLLGPNGYRYGKPTSLIAPGETTYNPETKDGDVVKGNGHEDTIPSYIEDGDQNVVYSDNIKYNGKTISEYAEPLVKQQKKLKDIMANAGGSELQLRVQKMLASRKMDEIDQDLLLLSELLNVLRNDREMKKFKNGKLPKFKWGEEALVALPNITNAISNWMDYTRAKNADTYAPDVYQKSPEWQNALNQLGSIRFDAAPYLNDARQAYNQTNWQSRRMVGLGTGGRALLLNANYQNYLRSLADIRTKENEANNQYRAAYADALAKYGAAQQEARTNSNIRKFDWMQQQNAAKEGYVAQYKKNALTAYSAMMQDINKMLQYNDSRSVQDQMMDLYRQLVNNDTIRAIADANRFNTPTEPTKLTPPTINTDTVNPSTPDYRSTTSNETPWWITDPGYDDSPIDDIDAPERDYSNYFIGGRVIPGNNRGRIKRRRV